MSKRFELFLKLALAKKAGESIPFQPSHPDLKGVTPGSISPIPTNEATMAATPVTNPTVPLNQYVGGLQNAKTAPELGQAVSADKPQPATSPTPMPPPAAPAEQPGLLQRAPEWVNGAINAVKSHPGLTAAGLGSGALLAYLMLRKRNRKHAAQLLPNLVKKPGTGPEVRGRIQAATERLPVSTGRSLVRPDLAMQGSLATKMKIREAAGRENADGVSTSEPSNAPAVAQSPLAAKQTPAEGWGQLAHEGEPLEAPKPVAAPAAVAAPAVEAAKPGMAAHSHSDQGSSPLKPALIGAGGAAVGAAGGAAEMAHLDAQKAQAADPNSYGAPQTGTGHAGAATGDAIQQYLAGFKQSPGQWGAGQWGGVGAAGLLLASLLSRSGD